MKDGMYFSLDTCYYVLFLKSGPPRQRSGICCQLSPHFFLKILRGVLGDMRRKEIQNRIFSEIAVFLEVILMLVLTLSSAGEHKRLNTSLT